jgi:hypothetical protein
MIATLDPLNPQFIYDAKRKIGIGYATDKAGKAWVLEFRERYDDDRMRVAVIAPDGKRKEVVASEDDFLFSDNTVQLSLVPELHVFMHPVYLKKMRGFTRGNIPTPDIAGPSLP